MGRSTKIGAIIGGLLAIGSSLAVVVFLILGLCGVFGLDNESVNRYRVTFTANETVLLDKYYTKGESIETDFTVPSKPDDEYATNYRFYGWDTNGDNIPNPVPTRVYRNIDAVALYRGDVRPYTPSSESEVNEL